MGHEGRHRVLAQHEHGTNQRMSGQRHNPRQRQEEAVHTAAHVGVGAVAECLEWGSHVLTGPAPSCRSEGGFAADRGVAPGNSSGAVRTCTCGANRKWRAMRCSTHTLPVFPDPNSSNSL